MPSELIQVLMRRDNLTEQEARDLCQECADLAHEIGASDSLQYAQVVAYELRSLGVNLSHKTQLRLCGVI